MKTLGITGAVFFFLFYIFADNGYCGNVDSLTFTWDAAVSGEQITGYKLCLGSTSRGAVLDYATFRYDREYDAGTGTQYTVAGLSGYTSLIYASVVAYKNTQISNYSTEVSWNNAPSTTSSSSSSTSSALSTTTTSMVMVQPATSTSIATTTVPDTTSSSTSILLTSTTTSSVSSTTTQPVGKPYDLQFRWNKR